MNITNSALLCLLSLCLAPTGCKESRASAANEGAAASQAALSAPAPAATKSEVTKIAFMDKVHACDCTKKRVDTGWAALQAALTGRTDITVERIHSDTEEAKVEPYHKLRAMMTLPALYFLDAKGGLVELLQGDLTTEQIADVLKR